jgi:cell division septation protein DedD
MSQQLATALRGEPAEEVLSVGPVVPVFVDATGRRRRWVIGFGWLVALACVAYLGVIGVSMSGTSVGPLPNLPSVPSRGVVFGSELTGLPEGALESPFAPPAQAAAPAPAAVKIAAPVAAVKPKPAVAPRVAAKPSTASRAAAKPSTASRTTAKPSTATRSTTKSSTARSASSPVRMTGTSR